MSQFIINFIRSDEKHILEDKEIALCKKGNRLEMIRKYKRGIGAIKI